MTDKFLIVGLGNPGREYRLNRHNIGFMLLDKIAERFGLGGFTRRQGQALVTAGEIAGAPVVLAKPQTYMNLSGQAVSTLVRFYNLPLKNLIICLDDIDLPVGTLRVRAGGGSAGQRGLQSIIDQLGTAKFARLRIGVGRPEGVKTAARHVLQDLRGEDWEIINLAMAKAVEAIPLFITDGVVLTMSRFNAPPPTVPGREEPKAEDGIPGEDDY